MKPATTKFHISCCDVLHGLRGIPDQSIDVIVTSPPYNLGIKYGAGSDDKLPREQYLDWFRNVLVYLRNKLKPDGSFFLNVGSSPSSPWLPFQLASICGDYFQLQNVIHWVKAVTVQTKKGELSVGHFKPINSKRFITDCHEYVLHLTLKGDVPLDRLAVGTEYADKSNIARFGAEGRPDRRCRGNVWQIPYETIRSRAGQRPHPATFPVELARRCIALHGPRECLNVLDPFVGIGNAAAAAKICGAYTFTGFDIEPEFIEETNKRLTLPE